MNLIADHRRKTSGEQQSPIDPPTTLSVLEPIISLGTPATEVPPDTKSDALPTPDSLRDTAPQPQFPEHPVPAITLPVTPQRAPLQRTMSASQSPTVQETQTRYDPPLKVLVVDDDSLTRRLMSRLLVRIGCEVDTAENGLQALEMLIPGLPHEAGNSTLQLPRQHLPEVPQDEPDKDRDLCRLHTYA